MDDENLILRKLAARAILEFEDVQGKCKEYHEKSTVEEKKRKKIEAQFKQLKQVSLLAVAEYESLHKQYVEENKYREEIEKQLKQTKDENVEIRKDYNMGATTTFISNDAANNGSQGTKGELEVLRSLKNAVNDELRKTKGDLSRLKEELQEEKSAHDVTKKHLSMNVEQVRQLNRVSILALDEYQELKKKYDLEMDCRKKAEEVAIDLVSQHKLDDRKSRLIIAENENEDQMKHFMAEIDELNAVYDQQIKEKDSRIKELEEEVTTSENTESLKSLEEKLSLVMDQLELAQKQLVTSEERAAKAEVGSRDLYARLAQAQQDQGATVRLPPPPPPPPPPIAAPVIRKFIRGIGKKKKGILGGAEQEEDPRLNAMADMIDRIKQGVKLKSVNSPAKAEDSQGDEDSSAMGELAGLLSNMKRGRAGSKDNLNDDKEEKQPEFVQVKLKKSVVKTASSFDSATTGPSNELKKKLAKQKSVAEGIDEKPEVTFIKPKEKQPVPLPTKNKHPIAVPVGVTSENNDSNEVVNTDKTDGSTSETTPPDVTKETKEDTKVNNSTSDQPPSNNNNINDTEKTPETSEEAKPESRTKVEDKEKEVVKTEKVENTDAVTPQTETTSDRTKEIDAGTPQKETKSSLTEEKATSGTTPKKLKEKSASWEAEMILDATGRPKTAEEEARQKVLNEREAAKKEYRKSVDDVFDGLLNDMIVSIDTASEGSGAARKSSRPSTGGSDAPV